MNSISYEVKTVKKAYTAIIESQAPTSVNQDTNRPTEERMIQANVELCESYSDSEDSDTESISSDEPINLRKQQADEDNIENCGPNEEKNYHINLVEAGFVTSSSDQIKNSTVQLRASRKSKFENETLNAVGVHNTGIINKKLNKLDSVRFSMYNIQDSHLNEIDALLNELNQLQTTLEFTESPTKTNDFPYLYTNPTTTAMPHNPALFNHQPDEIDAIDEQFDQVLKFLAESISGDKYNPVQQATLKNSSSSEASSPSFNLQKHDDGLSGSGSNSSGIGEDFYTLKADQKTAHKKRNSTDSAFGDTISMPSSINLNQPLAIINPANNHLQQSHNFSSPSSSSEASPVEKKSPTLADPKQQAEAFKAEQIRLALEKLKEANIKKIIVKAYTDDGCAKSVIIDETMKVYDVMLMLFSKNHSRPTVNFSVVEYLPKLGMERLFEDHENLVEAMSHWSRDSENQIVFTERAEKSELFLRPELYLSESGRVLDECQRSKLIEEFFQNIGSPVPEVEGPLYFKVESKKSWKKMHCVLRQSGLYMSPKGKSNKKDLQCLFSFDKLDLYYGVNWSKELKAPTDFCFALKNPQVQKKSSKYIKYLCCESNEDRKRWFNGIRVAKFGKQLLTNYKQMLDLIKINEITGRIPLVQNRRLSTSVSANNIRPRSSYSLVNQHIGLELASPSSSAHTIANSTRNSLVAAADAPNYGNADQTDTRATIIEPLLQIRHELGINKSDVSLNRTSSNVSYTDQLKSLLHAHQTQTQNLKRDIRNESNTPRSLSPKSRPIVNSTQNNNTLRHSNAKARIPLSTDITKQMLNMSPIYGTVEEAKHLTEPDMDSNATLTRSSKPTELDVTAVLADKACKNAQQTEIYITNIITKNRLEEDQKTEVSSSKMCFLQTAMIEKPSSNLLLRNSESIRPAPPVLPKPVYKRFISAHNQSTGEVASPEKKCDAKLVTNEKDNYNRQYNMKTGLKLTNRKSTCPANNTQHNSPELLDELATILARQKKKIDDSIEIQTVVTKPPPPPPRKMH